MFIPLHDANSLKYIKAQYVTIALIAANVVMWLFTSVADEDTLQAAAVGLGYVPALIHDTAFLPPEMELVPEGWTYLTYAFLHVDIVHLGGNMLFLWVFGDNVEDAMGHVRYLIFYLLCAAAAAWFHGFVQPDSQAPLIGASGAVAGIVAAYLMLHPRVKVWVLVLMRLPLRIPAFIPLVLWIGFQFLMVAVGGEDEISWTAHVGGIVAGALLTPLMRRRGVPLFDRAIVSPKAVVPEQPNLAAPDAAAQPTRWGRQ